MKTMLIISFTDLGSEPRVIRQLEFLKGSYQLIACGRSSPQIEGIEFIPVAVAKTKLFNKLVMIILLFMRQYEAVYWRYSHIKDAQGVLGGLKPDLVIAHDIETVPLVLKLFPQAKIILDAHEYAPRQFEDRFFWRLLIKPFKNYLCARYMPKLAASITVSQGIADEYARWYGVKQTVITNAPFYHSIKTRKTDPCTIRLIHHGITNPSRKIENMILLLDHLDERFYLDLMLKASNYPQYLGQINKMAAERKRVRLLEPVPMTSIVETIAEYDIGLYILEPLNFNSSMALPNKLFEFIQARLAVAIGPSPEMRSVVEKFGCGVVAPDFRPGSMAGVLNQLDAEGIDLLKEQSHKAAAVLCAENNKASLLKIVGHAL